jgi:hypothetical protein
MELGRVVGEKQSFAAIRFRYFHSKEIESPQSRWLIPFLMTELVAIVGVSNINTGRMWSPVAWVVRRSQLQGERILLLAALIAWIWRLL